MTKADKQQSGGESPDKSSSQDGAQTTTETASEGQQQKGDAMVPVLCISAIQICLIHIFGTSPVSFCRPARSMMTVMMLSLVAIQSMSHPTVVQIKRRKACMGAF